MSHNASVDIAVDEAMAAKAQAQAAAHAAELAALAAAPKPGTLEKEGMPERFINAGALGGNFSYLVASCVNCALNAGWAIVIHSI